MRKWLLFPAWASVGLLVYACDDDSNPVAKDGGTDAPTATQTSTTPTPPPMMDATPAEMDQFVPPMDSGPQPGPVDVQALDANGAPVSGIDVYFNEPGGTVVKVTTDATGHAQHLMLGGGSITALTAGPFNGSFQVTSVLDVQPSDMIKIAPPPATDLTIAATVTGSFLSAPAGGDAAPLTYALDFGGCNASVTAINTTSYSANISPGCLLPNKTASFLVVAKDGTGAVVGYAPKTVSIPDGGTITADIAMSDWSVPTSKQATYSGTQVAPFQYISASVGFPKNGFEYANAAAGTNNFTAPAAITYYPPPSTFAPNVQTVTQANGYYMGSDFCLVAHGARGPSATTTIAEDISQALPRISNVTPGGTGAAPTLTWGSAIGVAGVGSASLLSSHTPDGGAPYSVYWHLVFPSTAAGTTVQFPTLPAGIQAVVLPDQPWNADDVTFLVSPQVPYAIGHLLPGALNNGVNGMLQVVNAIPGLTTFDAKLTEVKPNSG
jgi:hypothetical protein